MHLTSKDYHVLFHLKLNDSLKENEYLSAALGSTKLLLQDAETELHNVEAGKLAFTERIESQSIEFQTVTSKMRVFT